ncbi:MAG: nitrous oxide reductase family maturation protein NosD [Phycisphaerales bacterium]
MPSIFGKLIGPRVPPEDLRARPLRYGLPTVLLSVARVLLLVSVFLPYWHMELVAPQYPGGLFLTAYVNHLTGDVKEIDGLNHYIGMRPLGEAAHFEKSIAVWAVIAMFLMVEGAMFIHSRWALLLALPAVLFPAGFLADLQYWMAEFGQNLDPSAPLSASVKPFTPTVLGEGGIGQFRTYADIGLGLWLAFASSAITILAFYFHRRAYKPLAERADTPLARACACGGRVRQAGRGEGGMNRLLATLAVALIAGARPAAGQPPADGMAPPAALAAGPAPRPAGPVNTGAIGRMIEAAPPGATVRVPAGLYREHIRIARPLTLIGEGRPVIDGEGRGDIVEIVAPGVTLRGFTIRGTGIDLDKENAAIRVWAGRATLEDNTLEDVLFGIDLRESPDSVIRNNRIGGKALDIARRGDGLRLWRADRALVEGNTIHDGRDAVLWYSTGVTARNNTSRACRYGFHLMFSDDVTLEGNHLEGNSVGIYLMYSRGVRVRGNRLIRNRGPSGYGLGFKETDRFTVENNLIAGNRVGIYLDGSPFTADQPGAFTRNIIARNDAGVTFLPAVRGNEFTLNSFIDNLEQVGVAGRGELRGNAFWKGETGNFWSDYTGYDQDHDGVGDFVHESRTLFENLMDREPKLRILLFSPAQQAIEFVGRALPAVRPESAFVDEVPLMRPPPIEGLAPLPGSGSGRPGLALASAALLALGGALVAAGRSPAFSTEAARPREPNP